MVKTVEPIPSQMSPDEQRREFCLLCRRTNLTHEDWCEVLSSEPAVVVVVASDVKRRRRRRPKIIQLDLKYGDEPP
jgi:hypothetical protein